MVNKINSDLPKILKNDLLTYKPLFNEEKIHIFYHLDFSIFLYLLLNETNVVYIIDRKPVKLHFSNMS